MHPIAGRLFKYGILLLLLAGLTALSAQEPAGGGPFKVQFGQGGISSLRYAGDKYDTEYIAPSRVLGHVMIRCQMGDNAWQQFSTSDPKNKSRQTASGPADALQQQTMIYNESGWDDYLDKNGYLERAFGTAMAYYTVPYKVAGWSAEELGNYDELVIADLLEELDAVGWKEKADQLRRAWESKVEHFVNDRPNLFWSEYPFDPTGFESHHAFARYAVEASKRSSTLKVKPADAADFMEEEISGNILTRGWLETSFWQLGVEGGMRYTSQMGGWAITDYALYYAKDPAKFLRLGYASLLSSWALMNSGTQATNFGFWYPGPENDDGTGSAYVSQPYGRTWAGKDQPRGPWSYSAEIDLGFGAALRATATIVAEDPIFGLIAYGGQLKKEGNRLEVIPLDGLRRRFHVMRGNARFHLKFDRDGFAAGQPIRFDEALNEISFMLENRAPGAAGDHTAEMTLSGLSGQSYEISLDGTALRKISGGPATNKIPLPVGKKEARVTIRKSG